MKIAIQGHPTRGKEVIQILESLGGRNMYNFNGLATFKYYIDSFNKINIAAYLTSDWKIYSLEEFEKEFPFKIGDTVIDGEGNEGAIIDLVIVNDKLVYSIKYNYNQFDIASPNLLKLKKKEMKEERNITLTLDKAKEWYRKGGELKEIALQAFTEKELTKLDLPKTWEEFCINYPVQTKECWLSGRGMIEQPACSGSRRYKNWIPSKKSAEAHLATMQLEQLRDCWRQGWEPTKYDTGYQIIHYPEEYSIRVFSFISFLSFPTKEMAEEFLECFRGLIEQAGDLV